MNTFFKENRRHEQQLKAVIFDLEGRLKQQQDLLHNHSIKTSGLQKLQTASQSQLIAYTSEMQVSFTSFMSATSFMIWAGLFYHL